MKKILIIVSLIAGTICTAQAQSACSQKLSEAEDLYEAGRLYEVTKVLKGECLEASKGGFTKEEKTKAYRLLALVYLFMDNEPDAEEAVINLLSVDKEHPLDENDPAELQLMMEKYRSKPIFRAGLYLGGNVSSAREITEFGSFNTNNNGFDDGGQINQDYSRAEGFGLHIGMTIEYEVIENLEIVLRTEYSQQAYRTMYNNISNLDSASFNAFNVDIDEEQSWLKIPLALKYVYPIGETGLAPYLLGGASYDYLLETKITGEREGTTSISITDLNIYDLNMRNKSNFSYFGGLGLRIESKRTDFFFIEAKYNVGVRNIVNGDNRYASDKLSFDLAHTDADKSINNLAFTLGYLHSFYNPKKYSEKKLLKLSKKK